MKVSIVIPTRNRPHSLQQCLSSIRRQAGEDEPVDIHVVDDASSVENADANRSLCQRYGAVHHELSHNRGMAVARNRGIQESAGEWVAFLDDDVVVADDWHENARLALASCTQEIVGIEGRVEGKGEGVWDREVQNLSGGLYITCHIIYRKSALVAAGGFDEQFEHEGPFHEDHELAVRMMDQGRILFDPRLRAVHLARNVHLLHCLRDAPRRLTSLLDAEFYFYHKHPTAYHRFRYRGSFWATYRSICTRHLWSTLRRRQVSVLLKHPLQAGALILASVIEQITACMLLLHFVNRAERGTRKPEVWFAAAIPGDSQGGVMRNMRAFADGLRSRGWRTRLLCGDPAHPCNYLSFAVKLLTAYLRHAIRPPQLLLARSTDAVFVAACAKLLRLDTRIILHNHGWEERIDALERRAAHLPQPAPHTTFRARILRFPLLRLTLRMSDGVLCGTVSDARWLRRSHAHCPPVHVVCNGVDKEDVALPQASSDQPNCNFCCVGAWNWRKNAYHSLMAFDLLHEVYPESRLYCIGMEPCDSLERVLARMRHPQSVEIVGTVPMSEMPHWYRRCSFLISSSRFEGGHPLALLEAMAAGCIVFASDIPAHRELLRNRRNGVLITGISPTDDAAEIVDVLRDSGGSRHMRSRACNTALRYRWERQVSRMERVVWKQIPR